MRQIIFRVLAGIIALLGIWAVVTQKPPLLRAIPELIVMAAFSAFALYGPAAGDLVLILLVHGPRRSTDPKTSNGQANLEDDSFS